MRRGGCRASRLRRRYGCFQLPRVPGAHVKKGRAGVGWLARTDPVDKVIEFSEHWDKLPPQAKRYIVLHERAHLATGPDHNEAFYSALKKLIAENKVPWDVAFEVEAWNCHKDH